MHVATLDAREYPVVPSRLVLAGKVERERIDHDSGKTTLLELHGVGPIVAALILAHVGDPARFATPARFASSNGTAPIEASSRPRKRHRLNPRGNRKLNHAMHLIAATQIRHETAGRVYYQRKIAEGSVNSGIMVS